MVGETYVSLLAPLMFRAAYIQRKQGKRQLSSSIYLTEAESFLEQYAKRSPQNQALIGSAGNSVRAEDFLAITEGARDEEDDLEKEREPEPITSIHPVKDTVQRDAGLIVFFPGKLITLAKLLFFFLVQDCLKKGTTGIYASRWQAFFYSLWKSMPRKKSKRKTAWSDTGYRCIDMIGLNLTNSFTQVL